MPDVWIARDGRELAQRAAAELSRELSRAIADHGSATWVLAGGTTPAATYKVLADSYSHCVDWQAVQVLAGDERCVPPDSPDSNWHVASTILLERVPIPDSQLHRPLTELPAEVAAQKYAATLSRLPRNERGEPRLDVVWLGIGEDGHTLSLFPGRPATMAAESLVVAVHDAPKPPSTRISLTLRALRGCVTAFIMASGPAKTNATAQVMGKEPGIPAALAVAEIEKSGGHVRWLLDASAAAGLGE